MAFPVALSLSAAGVAAGTIGALLVTLPDIRLVTAATIARSNSVRTSAASLGAVIVAGLLGAGPLSLLQL